MSSLQQFADEFYRRPGVAALLLELQDRHGLDVLLLLTACWLGRRGVSPQALDWPALDAGHAQYAEQLVQPLRRVRRQLNGLPNGELVKGPVLEAELALEWWLLARLEKQLDQLPGGSSNTLSEQLLGCAACRGQPPAQPLSQLCQLAGAETQSG